MLLSKSQKRMLDKLRKLSPEDLTEEDKEDLQELEQLEAAETKPNQNQDDPLKSINESLEEIKQWMKPQQPKPQETVEIPTPPPAVNNQPNEEEKPKPNKMKNLLKSLW